MPDIRYRKFVLSTVLKLTVYMLMCIAVRLLCARFAPYPVDKIIPWAAAAVITWFFLTYIEQGKRSFFAKGYMVENILPGAVYGVAVFALSVVLECVMGKIRVNGLITDFDVREPVYEVMAYSLFAGVVIFGYVFHILKQDFGAIPAVIISSVLYLVYSVFFHSSWFGGLIKSGNLSNPDTLIPLINVLLIGIAACLLEMYLGDMRSAASFLCFVYFMERLTVYMLAGFYRSRALISSAFLYQSFIFTAVLIIFSVKLIISIKRKD